MNKPLIGLIQALGVAIYCGLIAGFFQLAKSNPVEPEGILIAGFMLVLLVFSVAVVGSIIFGYPAYLVVNKRVREALAVLGFTLAFCLIIILAVLAILFL